MKLPERARTIVASAALISPSALQSVRKLVALALWPERLRVIVASAAQGLRRAGYLAEIAYRRFEAGLVDSPVTLAPMYHH